MRIRRNEGCQCLTGMYDFNKKQVFSCRYRQENARFCIRLVSFLPIIYGIHLNKRIFRSSRIVRENRAQLLCAR